MKILVDAMGGDHDPAEIVKGAVEAAAELDIKIVLVGIQDVICNLLMQNPLYESVKAKIEIINADEVIDMEDDPFSVMRAKKNSSMSVAMRMLAAGEADAMVSAGNTGAMFTGSSMIVRPIKHVRRGAIATILPLEKPLLLLDSGANVTVTAEYLVHFAYIGSVYMNKLFGIESPRVALLNNGTESCKGTPALVEAYKQLEKMDINFIGNVEAKDIPFGKCDVLVTDGFTGNIVLKYTEGIGKFFLKKLKSVFYSNIITKASALLLKKHMSGLRREFDASEYGGAPILGISHPVIKAHGSSDARAIRNAIRQAVEFVKTDVIRDIAERALDIFVQKTACADSDESQADTVE